MTTRVRRRRLVVAIDGPAGAGKSTVAKRLAAELGYSLLDTGAIYRSVALAARREGVAWSDEPGLARIAEQLAIRFRMVDGNNRVWLGEQDVSAAIREAEISRGASEVSALPAVRAALLGLQRRLGQRGGVVAEGRDIGTVVFPGAEAKFFLTASEEARAQRRHQELAAVAAANGAAARLDLTETLREMRSRDERDANRAVAPLTQAEDALRIDCSDMTADEVVRQIRSVVRQRERSGATPGIG